MPIAVLIPLLVAALTTTGIVVKTYEPGAVLVEKVQHDLRQHWHLSQTP